MNAQAERIREYLSKYYQANEWPTLLWQAEEWSRTLPLEGLRVLDGTPLYRNTLGKLMALLAAGAEVWVPARPGMPSDPAVVSLLEGFGIPRAPRTMDDFDIILDCSGQFRELHPRLGFAELTRTGVHRHEHTHHPVILADSGRIKRIEAVLGTGEGFFRAMAQLGHTEVAGRQLLIIGLGKVGQGVLHYALRKGMKVTVADLEDKREMLPAQVAFVDANKADALNEAVLRSWCTVTATGHIAALRRRLHPEQIIPSDTLLANLGVEDEYGPEFPEDLDALHRDHYGAAQCLRGGTAHCRPATPLHAPFPGCGRAAAGHRLHTRAHRRGCASAAERGLDSSSRRFVK